MPSDSHRSGELDFNDGAHARARAAAASGLATFLLGDVTSFGRYVSSSTDARERQWRQFYYVQDTWRADAEADAQLRPARSTSSTRRPSTRPGNGGWLDLDTGEIRVGGVGDIDLAGNVENKINWAPRLGATYQINEKTVIRAGYGRSYDIGVFGSTFGHSVTQNLPVLARPGAERAEQLRRACSTWRRARRRRSSRTVPRERPLPAARTASSRARCPTQQRLPDVDACNVTVQRQLTTDDLRRDRATSATRARTCFTGDGPAVNVNQPTHRGLRHVPTTSAGRSSTAPTVERLRRRLRLDAGHRLLLQLRRKPLRLAAGKLTKRFAERLLAARALHAAERARTTTATTSSSTATSNYGPADWDRTHIFVLAATASCRSARASGPDRRRTGVDACRRLAVQRNATIQSGLPFNVGYRDAGQDRDTGPEPARTSIGDPTTGGGTQRPLVQRDADRLVRAARSARPAAGTFGDLERNALRGPGYWNVDASLFKRFRLGEQHEPRAPRRGVERLQPRQPRATPTPRSACPATTTPNAGRINSTALTATPIRSATSSSR